jgi:predicted O-methyltransferase YrrM
MAWRDLRATNTLPVVIDTKSWTTEEVLNLGRSYQGAAVLAAAAELELFTALAPAPLNASALARRLDCDLRALSILLDALAAIRLLVKTGDRFALPPGLDTLLSADGSRSVLAMCQHQANCLRRWAQLAKVVKTGRPAERTPSVRGEAGDQQSFIGAMDNISAPTANHIIRALQPLQFQHLLDIGGASGTWTIAFLQACPSAQATIFDLPEVVPMAQHRVAAAGLRARVRFAAGDFMADALPPGADLAWVSAIVHQNSRAQNRLLFAKTFQALLPGGRIAIRDILMEESRTRPVAGALFAVNMLVGTEGGATFTFDELRADLEHAGFIQAAVVRADEAMNAIVVAAKPA